MFIQPDLIVGNPGIVELRPQTKYMQVINQTKTVAKGERRNSDIQKELVEMWCMQWGVFPLVTWIMRERLFRKLPFMPRLDRRTGRRGRSRRGSGNPRSRRRDAPSRAAVYVGKAHGVQVGDGRSRHLPVGQGAVPSSGTRCQEPRWTS